MRNRIKYSQNFLTNTQLVESLVSKSSISREDTVIEIGAGEGIITKALVKIAGKVVAFELDSEFYRKLSYYNNSRMHTKLNRMSPREYKQKMLNVNERTTV